MSLEESRPRSKILRDALDKGNTDKTDVQEMLTVAEVCGRLRVSKWTVYRLMQAGRLSSVKIGSRRLIPTRALARLIEELEAEGGG